MKHTTFLSAFAGALALICLSGCGGYNLKSIQLSTQAATTVGGFYELKGEGGTLQLQAIANYSNHTSKDITPRVTYTVTIATPGVDDQGNALQLPPNTVTVSPTGLLTAVEPFVCTYFNQGTTTAPIWVLTGSYRIVANFNGVTSQPVYIGVASAASNTGTCGP